MPRFTLIKQDIDDKNTVKRESVFPLFEYNWDFYSDSSTKKEQMFDERNLKRSTELLNDATQLEVEDQMCHEKMFLIKPEEIKQEPDGNNELQQELEHQISVASRSSLTRADMTYTKKLEHVMFHEEMFKLKQEQMQSCANAIKTDIVNNYSVGDTAEKLSSLPLNTGLISEAGESV